MLEKKTMYRDCFHKNGILLYGMMFLVCFVLVACTPAETPGVIVEPVSTRTPTPSRTPLPTWTPTPIPTATPIPPAILRLNWPYTVTPLNPVPIEVEFTAPPGLQADAVIDVAVIDPAGETYAIFDLTRRDGFRFIADAQLQLPLNPMGGYWWVIAHAETPLDVEGESVIIFIPEQVQYRPLEGILPERVQMLIPIAFSERERQGDLYSGSKIWQHNDGQLGLWWAPGPTEALLLSNAVAMLEASFPADGAPSITDVAETLWFDRTTYVFNLTWPDAQPGMAWVVQDDDFWLYIVEIRALAGGQIPTLIEEVASTFHFVD